MNDVIVYTHKDCLLKFNGNKHPERKERLEIIKETILKLENKKIHLKECDSAQIKYINYVHPIDYIDPTEFLHF